MAEDITKEAKFADGTVADLHFVRSFGKVVSGKMTRSWLQLNVSIQIPDQTWSKLQHVNIESTYWKFNHNLSSIFFTSVIIPLFALHSIWFRESEKRMEPSDQWSCDKVWEVNADGLKFAVFIGSFRYTILNSSTFYHPKLSKLRFEWGSFKGCAKITLTWSGIRIAMNVGRGRRRKVIDPPNGWPWHTMTKSWEPLVAYASDLHWLTWVGLPHYVWQYQPIDIVKDLSWPYTWYNFSCHASCVIQRVWTFFWLELLHLISERSKRS